jgi:hypothetical protein
VLFCENVSIMEQEKIGDAKTGGIPYCSISKLNTMALIRDLLLNKQKRIEIWESEGRSKFVLGKKVRKTFFEASSIQPYSLL